MSHGSKILLLLYHLCRSFSSIRRSVFFIFAPDNPLWTASPGSEQRDLPCLVHQQQELSEVHPRDSELSQSKSNHIHLPVCERCCKGGSKNCQAACWSSSSFTASEATLSVWGWERERERERERKRERERERRRVGECLRGGGEKLSLSEEIPLEAFQSFFALFRTHTASVTHPQTQYATTGCTKACHAECVCHCMQWRNSYVAMHVNTHSRTLMRTLSQHQSAAEIQPLVCGPFLSILIAGSF